MGWQRGRDATSKSTLGLPVVMCEQPFRLSDHSLYDLCRGLNIMDKGACFACNDASYIKVPAIAPSGIRLPDLFHLSLQFGFATQPGLSMAISQQATRCLLYTSPSPRDA